MEVLTKETNSLEIIDTQKFSLVYNKETKTLSVIPKENLNLDGILPGDLQIKAKSLSFITENEISFDSLLPEEQQSIYFNSKMAKQIRHLPESEEWRKKNFLKLDKDQLIDELLEEPACLEQSIQTQMTQLSLFDI